jgi:glycerophosphoryl diester phosphodiesterase
LHPLLVLAHRGLHDDARENSMAAFAAAVAAGVDGIETDVRLTRDGVPVLFHDPRLRRRPVAAMTRNELSRALQHHVPSLAEAIERFDVLWNVEIKSRDAVAATLRVLERFAATRRFLVTSFLPDVVTKVAHELDVECGRIFSRGPVARRTNAGAAVVFHFKLLNARRLRRERRAGRRIVVYGPATLADHRRCVHAGIDGVITDWPERVRQVV